MKHNLTILILGETEITSCIVPLVLLNHVTYFINLAYLWIYMDMPG